MTLSGEDSPYTSSTSSLYNVLAITAHEAKSMTLLALEPERAYTVTPLHKRVMSLQSDNPGWQLRKSAPHEYCAGFAEQGLVEATTVTVDVNGVERPAQAYSVIEAARNRMLPFVAHLLNISLTEEQSLLEIFGSPQNNSEEGPRPSQARLAVLGQIATVGGRAQRISDLTKTIGTRLEHKNQIIQDMAYAELLTVTTEGSPQTRRFTAKPELQQANFRRTALGPVLEEVVRAINTHFNQDNPVSFTDADVAHYVSASGLYEANATTLQLVTRATTYLADQRRLLEGEHEHKVVWTTEKQLQLIHKILAVVNGFHNPTEAYLEQGHDIAQGFLSNKTSVDHVMRKAKRSTPGRKNVSAGLNLSNKLQVHSAISAYLAAAEAPLTRQELQTHLQSEQFELDISSVNKHVAELIKEGKVAARTSEQGSTSYSAVVNELRKD